MSAAGPYDRWPLGRGFERYFGFLGGDTHQFYPDLVRDNSQTEPEKTPEQGYHLTEDLVEKAKAMIADAKQVAPDKPFFLYFAPGAMHSPHHVIKEWSDAYRGAFDGGWQAYRNRTFERQKALGVIPSSTVLSRRDPDVPDWETCSEIERKVYARMMEVFAGFLTHTDHCIGAARPVSEGHRRVRQHPHHARLGQRLERRGWTDRLAQRVQVLPLPLDGVRADGQTRPRARQRRARNREALRGRYGGRPRYIPGPSSSCAARGNKAGTLHRNIADDELRALARRVEDRPNTEPDR